MIYNNKVVLDSPPLLKTQKPYDQFFNHLSENRAFYQKSVNQAIHAVVEFLEKRKTPFTGISVDEVKSKFTGNVLEQSSALTIQEALDELQHLYLNDTIAFHHPKYLAHLNCPVLIPTLVAEIISSAVNTSMDTWDQSIGATFIEQQLIEWTLKQIAYPQNADGIFTSGGTQSNLMGLLLARDEYIHKHYNINSKISGLPDDAAKFRIFCSELSHFSLKKNASLLGLGQKAIIPVRTDKLYKMDIAALKEAILACKREGNIPIAVVATAGTTDFGSIDPLSEIAGIAREHQLWFHVDAAYGGGLILSEKHKAKLHGIEDSDSVTIDYHKTFFQPVASSGFFMRDKKYISHISYYAEYLNSKEQEADGLPNMVKKSIQTTRRFDALKLWLTLRVTGINGLGQFIDDIIELANDTTDLMSGDNDFEVLNQPEISAIVFRLVPSNYALSEDEISSLNACIRKSMFNEGAALIASTKFKGATYLKFTLLNPLTKIEHIQEVISHIKLHGDNWCQQNEFRNKNNEQWIEHLIS